jgi:sortase B
MKKKTKKRIGLAACAVVIAVAGVNIYRAQSEYAVAEGEYDQIADAVYLSDEPVRAVAPEQTAVEEEEESPYFGEGTYPNLVVDHDALKKVNEDYEGWLYVPCLEISYPVVQAEDNSFYLHRDIDLNYSSYGTLFTEAMSARDFDNDNSIIYGHHMKDGGMFALLVNYAKKDFYEKHPVFYLNTPEMNYRVEVFAAFLTDMYSDAYNNSFDSDEEMQAWLDAAKEQSAIETDVEVVPGDRVLTLSTCTYEYDTARYVVLGKMIPIR